MNSASRASFIQELSYRWSGMYIFVFYAHSGDSSIIERMITITSHSVRVQVVIVTANSDSVFPINSLRNTGIRQVTTSHYAVTDMDLWPSCSYPFQWSWVVNLYDEMHSIPTRFLTDDRMAIIIPIFFFNLSLINDSMSLQESFSMSYFTLTLILVGNAPFHRLWMLFIPVYSMEHAYNVNQVFSLMYPYSSVLHLDVYQRWLVCTE